MPNWCAVSVEVTGDKNELLDFAKGMIGKNDVIYQKGLNEEKFKHFDGLSREEQLDVLRKMREAQEDVLTYSNHVPMPDKYLIEDEGSGFDNDNWYRWRHASWGVKWDIGDGTTVEEFKEYIQEVEEDLADSVYFYMDCPWSYPDKFFESVSRKYQNLTFTVTAEESGVGLYRVSTFFRGEEEFEFDSDNELIFRNYLGDMESEIADTFFFNLGEDLSEVYDEDYVVDQLAEYIKATTPKESYEEKLEFFIDAFEEEEESVLCKFKENVLAALKYDDIEQVKETICLNKDNEGVA